jgi:hypothetical protein
MLTARSVGVTRLIGCGPCGCTGPYLGDKYTLLHLTGCRCGCVRTSASPVGRRPSQLATRRGSLSHRSLCDVSTRRRPTQEGSRASGDAAAQVSSRRCRISHCAEPRLTRFASRPGHRNDQALRVQPAVSPGSWRFEKPLRNRNRCGASALIYSACIESGQLVAGDSTSWPLDALQARVTLLRRPTGGRRRSVPRQEILKDDAQLFLE